LGTGGLIIGKRKKGDTGVGSSLICLYDKTQERKEVTVENGVGVVPMGGGHYQKIRKDNYFCGGKRKGKG